MHAILPGSRLCSLPLIQSFGAFHCLPLQEGALAELDLQLQCYISY